MERDNQGNPFVEGYFYEYSGKTYLFEEFVNKDIGWFHQYNPETLKPLNRRIDYLFTPSFVCLGPLKVSNNREAVRLLQKEW